MVKIGLLSDTHGYLPPQLYEHFANVDEVWHAGDIGTLAVADALEAFKPLRMITGNIDGQELRVRYPEHLFFTIERVSVLITHIGCLLYTSTSNRCQSILIYLLPYRCNH